MSNSDLDTGSRPGADRSTVNPTMGAAEWSMIAVLSMFWGGSFYFVEIAVNDMTPFTIVFIRVGVAALLLLAYVRISGRKMPMSAGLWGSFFVIGFLNNVIPFSLIVWGQQHIEGSLAAILNATSPIFSVFLAHFLTSHERLSTNRVSGIVMGWLGVAVLIGVDSLGGIGKHTLGQLAVVIGSHSYALAAIYARRFRDLSPVIVATGMLSASAVMMLPLSLIIDQPWHLSPGIESISAVLAMAVLSTALANLIYFRVLASAGATNALLVTFLIPISAIILNVLLLGERPGWNAFVGMAFIFIGLASIDGRLPRRFGFKAPDSSG